MSWSRSISGTPAVVKEQAAKWAKEQEGYDKNLSDVAKAGHQQQIKAAETAVVAFADALPADKLMAGSVWGHAGDSEGNVQLGISLNCS